MILSKALPHPGLIILTVIRHIIHDISIFITSWLVSFSKKLALLYTACSPWNLEGEAASHLANVNTELLDHWEHLGVNAQAFPASSF